MFWANSFGILTQSIGKYKYVSSFLAQESTIYALASGGARCAVAIVRISGNKAGEVLKALGCFKSLPEPRKAILRQLCNGPTVLDNAIILWFPGPKSYTGEDSCEFHVHGGPAVISSVLKSIGNFSGCRMAEPGEFTKRAFLNGKMDLTEVDGLNDLISAETEMQRVQALNQMSGSLGKVYEDWRNRIAKCLANAEAYIDFGEDENIESDILENINSEVGKVLYEINLHINDKRKGERLRNGVRVAIIGKPNAGKSSLLNFLSKREAAIVSDIAGTTRDVVETVVNIDGFPVIFADTAGLRFSTGDKIEMEGIRRAINEAIKADLIILVLDDFERAELLASRDRESIIEQQLGYVLQNESSSWEKINLNDISRKTLVVLNKIDLVRESTMKKLQTGNGCEVMISCKTNEGMNNFLQSLRERFSELCANPKEEEAVFLTQERYRSHLENCCTNLENYLKASFNNDLALKTENLKYAMNSIGYITGHYGTEDILDIIFRDFCIGK